MFQTSCSASEGASPVQSTRDANSVGIRSSRRRYCSQVVTDRFGELSGGRMTGGGRERRRRQCGGEAGVSWFESGRRRQCR